MIIIKKRYYFLLIFVAILFVLGIILALKMQKENEMLLDADIDNANIIARKWEELYQNNDDLFAQLSLFAILNQYDEIHISNYGDSIYAICDSKEIVLPDKLGDLIDKLLQIGMQWEAISIEQGVLTIQHFLSTRTILSLTFSDEKAVDIQGTELGDGWYISWQIANGEQIMAQG